MPLAASQQVTANIRQHQSFIIGNIDQFNDHSFHVQDILVHEDPKIDLAILVVDNNHWHGIKPFRNGQYQLGEEVLSIGFPPIPGFDGLKVLEHGEIGSEIKTMNGQIVSTGTSYRDSTDYLLINARVKGGSSGAPVINRSGRVIGVVVDAAINASSSDELTDLGYGIVTPFNRAVEMLQHNMGKQLPFQTNPNGSICTIP